MGFKKIWGMEWIDIIKNRNVLNEEKVEKKKINLNKELLDSVNCSDEIFRWNLKKVKERNYIIKK